MFAATENCLSLNNQTFPIKYETGTFTLTVNSTGFMLSSPVENKPATCYKQTDEVAVTCPFHEPNVGSCMQSRITEVTEFCRRGTKPKRWSLIRPKLMSQKLLLPSNQ